MSTVENDVFRERFHQRLLKLVSTTGFPKIPEIFFTQFVPHVYTTRNTQGLKINGKRYKFSVPQIKSLLFKIDLYPLSQLFKRSAMAAKYSERFKPDCILDSTHPGSIEDFIADLEPMSTAYIDLKYVKTTVLDTKGGPPFILYIARLIDALHDEKKKVRLHLRYELGSLGHSSLPFKVQTLLPLHPVYPDFIMQILPYKRRAMHMVKGEQITYNIIKSRYTTMQEYFTLLGTGDFSSYSLNQMLGFTNIPAQLAVHQTTFEQTVSSKKHDEIENIAEVDVNITFEHDLASMFTGEDEDQVEEGNDW